MQPIHTRIEIGLPAPICVLHASDTHLTHADARDGQRKVELAKNRLPGFPDADQRLAELGRLSHELGLPIMHTGDLIDFVSLANLEAAKAFADSHDIFMATGNHEFSLYVGEAWEDADYRNQSLAAVQACYKNDIRMSSRMLRNGDAAINFIALDNGYYYFEPEQLDFLKAQVALGLPVVLMIHTPLYDRALYDAARARTGSCAYLAGVPDELIADYDPYRYRQQKTDATTAEFLEYVAGEPAIKCILAGHLHVDFDGTYVGRPQLISGGSVARVVEFY
ncbi:MAG: metallophosphoesterase [Clostridia bacterium]|nr:metallophosphoesterase [Clostridia bacterium]